MPNSQKYTPPHCFFAILPVGLLSIWCNIANTNDGISKDQAWSVFVPRILFVRKREITDQKILLTVSKDSILEKLN